MASKSYDYSFKIILIGDSDAGKTSLLYRYAENSPERFTSTIGMDFKIKNIILDEKQIKLQFCIPTIFSLRLICLLRVDPPPKIEFKKRIGLSTL